MATFHRLPSGNWRAQIRRRNQISSRTFRLKAEAEQWAREADQALDAGRSIEAPKLGRRTPFKTLIQLHLDDLKDVGRQPLRSKSYTLGKLKQDIGHIQLGDLNREFLIDFGKRRAKAGAGPVTLGMEVGYIRTVLVHAAAVHGIQVPTEQVTLARVALGRLGLVGKGNERDRRPTFDEIERLVAYSDCNNRQIIPLGRIIKFAIATAMRQDEICRLRWPDIDMDRRLATVRDRKDPRHKDGNHQKVPLLDANGYDPIALLKEQKFASPDTERVFPYNGRSVGTAFRRACQELKIEDLHFHDLRHEATSRLFEAGYEIPEVSLVTGHKDWKMLRRYLNLRPHQLLLRKPTPRGY